jgi:hypothetical protein
MKKSPRKERVSLMITVIKLTLSFRDNYVIQLDTTSLSYFISVSPLGVQADANLAVASHRPERELPSKDLERFASLETQ